MISDAFVVSKLGGGFITFNGGLLPGVTSLRFALDFCLEEAMEEANLISIFPQRLKLLSCEGVVMLVAHLFCVLGARSWVVGCSGLALALAFGMERKSCEAATRTGSGLKRG